VHINDYIRTVGRKPLAGDVIEVPNLKDEFALNEWDVGLPKYFVISDVGRAAEGFSPTWYPHLYRLKLTKISNSQQYKDIFAQKIVDPVTGEETDKTLADILSSANKALEINDALIAQAEADAPMSGYETRQFYTLALDESGNAALQTIDNADLDASLADGNYNTAATVMSAPKRSGYTGYLLGDGVPENGAYFGHGITFPNGPVDGDYFLRTDFLPNRLFKFDGTRWVKREDAVRTTMTPTSTRNTQKGTFINNINRVGVDLLATDTVTVSTNTIVTDIDFIVGMYASGALPTSSFSSLTVTEDVDGKAVITLPDTFTTGSKVEWKLYKSSVEERQALSKALKPKADL
jgi:hypothetical protein